MNFDRITAFYTYSFWEAFHSKGNEVCVINSFHGLLWIFLKPCIHFVNIMKMGMFSFDGNKTYF